MPKRKSLGITQASMVIITIYGIWDNTIKQIVYVALKEEDVEMEYDMQGYTENTHSIVLMPTCYDSSSLESLA